jgi:hypothetical protein
MFRGAELRQQMAITTNGVQIFGRKRETMWVVAIGARNPLVIHPALHERAILIVLFLNLSIGEINTLIEETRNITIQK